MLRELCDAMARVGLELRSDKTVFLVKSFGRHRTGDDFMKLDEASIKVLAASKSTAHLGRMLNVDGHASLHDVEIKNRIAAAWRKFWALSRELASKKFSSRSRLHHLTVLLQLLY